MLDQARLIRAQTENVESQTAINKQAEKKIIADAIAVLFHEHMTQCVNGASPTGDQIYSHTFDLCPGLLEWKKAITPVGILAQVSDA